MRSTVHVLMGFGSFALECRVAWGYCSCFFYRLCFGLPFLEPGSQSELSFERVC